MPDNATRSSAPHESAKKDRSRQAPRALAYYEAAREVLLEMFWPTRCVVCDAPGTLLCDRCRLSLPYIDYWRSCPRCGGPFGTVQCSECNPVTLKELGLRSLPYHGCVSTLAFTPTSARLITTFKDQNERGLAAVMAQMLAYTIPPSWLSEDSTPTVSFIPATHKALRRRGFDHAELFAREVSQELELPLVSLLARPVSKDQRQLSRQERIANMDARFTIQESSVPKSILLIDDVYTTGATLCSASKALIDQGAESVHCATFARVW